MMSDLGKQRAAEAALDYIKPGMIVGLGTGSTANFFIRELAHKVANGLDVRGVPTSQASRELARALGIRLLDVDHVTNIAVTVDGADEIDPAGNLLKGGGGALLREKIIASASDLMVVIADSGKLVPYLGPFGLPIEVTVFGMGLTATNIGAVLAHHHIKADVAMREGGAPGLPYMTDNGNVIYDCHCDAIIDPANLCVALNQIPGVMENGIFPLFHGRKRIALIGGQDGVMKQDFTPNL